MHRDVIRPVLHYFTRDGLEGLQLLSKLLRDLINNASMTLPLRYIKRVIVVSTPSRIPWSLDYLEYFR